ncbi:MAG: DNA integrity scanning diadenylate cyclase DisA [Bacillota bacterium]
MNCLKDGERFTNFIRITAPGTLLREALESILKARMGALIIINDSTQVMDLVDGGFTINCDLTPAALYELAKMDGAIILSSDGKRILRANAHLVPQPAIPTEETGIRHRIAERMARQTGAMVTAISQRRSVITLYQGGTKYILQDVSLILARANEAIQTLEKYRSVLDRTLSHLTILEFEEVVALLDAVRTIQRAEMVVRIGKEIELYITQLGTEGRLVSMQLEELTVGVEEAYTLLIRDYHNLQGEKTWEQVFRTLRQLSAEELLDTYAVSRALGYGGTAGGLDSQVQPRGYRVLHKIPRLPFHVVENLVETLNGFQGIVRASTETLDEVNGIGGARARTIREGLAKLREQALMSRIM